jgi:hypothetical protein
MTEREGSVHGAAARELLIDRQLPRFGEPDYGKVATSFLVLPYGTQRCLLCTETRTATTDPASAR